MNKRIMSVFLAVILTATMLGGCSNTSKEQNTGNTKQKITLMVDHDYRVDDIGGYLTAKYPDIDFDIVLGRNGVDYLKKAAENDDLPDIMISGSTWGRTGAVLNDYLYDLSSTDIASNFYSVYLDNYTTADGSVYWLPGCAAIEGVMANKTLFDENNIELPTDYASFVDACEKFTALGIRPYASDYKYDYTCAYLLQSWSIPLLQSEKGKEWRLSYEEGSTNTLDETIGLEMFEKLASFFELTGVTADDASRGYGATAKDIANGNVAMIRQSTNNSSYYDMGLTDLVILPYFGETVDDSWYFTTPSYAIALSGKIKGTAIEDTCLDIVRSLFSQECMDIFAEEVQAFTAYNKGITFEVKDEFKNIVPYVESNHMYTYLAQDNFKAASKLAVQKMIKENATPAEALAAFNETVVQTAAEEPVVTTFDVAYSREWTENGNKALSSVANTLAEIVDCDILLAPFTICSSSVYSGTYNSTQLGNLLYGGGLNFYVKELSGADIKRIVKAAVEGRGTSYDPISVSTLPATSGCEMVVSKVSDGKYTLDDLLINGKSIEDSAKYNFVYADNTPALLRTEFNWDKAAHDGKDIAVDMSTEGIDASFEGFLYHSKHIADYWLEYFANGGKIAEPSAYISIK